MAKKKIIPPAPVAVTYMLRTCDSKMQGHGGFQWPESGPVACPDWDPTPKCGNGLHGLLMGEGNGSLLNWTPDAKWMVVEVDPSTVVNLDGKVKVPGGVVVFCGDRLGATNHIISKGANPATCVGGTATAGDGGTATAGYRGTATAGDYGTATAGDGGTATAGHGGTATAGDEGTATAGDEGTATAGHEGTATAGYEGTATAGDGGTATAGVGGTIQITWWDGKRYRIATGYVGEDGIEPGTKYKVMDGKLVLADA